MPNKRNFLMMRWVDSTPVDMLSAVHDHIEIVLKKGRNQKRINSTRIMLEKYGLVCKRFHSSLYR
jgi:hypothetical protein